jgi:hypothetical protein
MLHYSPTHRKYPGDALMRPSTQQHSSRRTFDKEEEEEEDDDNNNHQPARKRGRPKDLDDDEVVGKVTKKKEYNDNYSFVCSSGNNP